MADTPNDTSGTLTDQIDRRSALKKAAAAGAIAWTAPMILSSTAHADHDPAGNGVCTPSCAPPAFGLTFTATDACNTGEQAAIEAVVGTGNKIAVIEVNPVDTVTCPCDPSTDPVTIIALGNLSEFTKGNQPCPVFDAADPSNIYAEPHPWADDPLHPGFENSFIVYKEGAIGNGWYTGNGSICVSVGCPDEVGGDIVYRTCQFNICFRYSPAGSICTISALDVVPTQVGNCTVSCDHCTVGG